MGAFRGHQGIPIITVASPDRELGRFDRLSFTCGCRLNVLRDGSARFWFCRFHQVSLIPADLMRRLLHALRVSGRALEYPLLVRQAQTWVAMNDRTIGFSYDVAE